MKTRASELHDAFDRRFAEAPAPVVAAQIDLLRVRLGGEPHAIALGQVAGLHAGAHVVPMPSPAAELRGIASVRNAIVPVYDLRAVLELASGSPARWLVIAHGTPAVGFAFDGFDGLVRVGGPVRAAIVIAGQLHPIIDLAAVRDTVHARWNRKG